MRTHELFDPSTRYTALLLLAAFAAAGCGSIGDGGLDNDGDDDDPSPDLPSLVQVGGSGQVVFGLAVGDSMPVSFNLGGHWTPATDSLSLEQGGLAGDSGPSRFGPFQIAIVSPLRWASGSFPAEGEWTLTAGALGFPAHVVADADGAGSPGMAVSFVDNGFPAAETTLVWEDVLDPDQAAPAWVDDASTGFRVLDLAFAHFRMALGDLAFAITHDDDLEAAGGNGVTVDGPLYPGSGATGSLNCRWDDRSPNGGVGPADDFRFLRQSWWFPGPGPRHGFLLSGSWSLEGYIENRDPLVAVGGTTAFAGLTWAETREVGGVWSMTGTQIITTGTGNVFAQEMP